VVVVGGGVEHRWVVALSAERVPLGAQAQPVRFVAVEALHAGRVHLALREGAVDEDLGVDLPVGVVGAGVEEAREAPLEEGLARVEVLRKARPQGVAAPAGVERGGLAR
jgi:hypothetical protein